MSAASHSKQHQPTLVVHTVLL